MWQGRRVLVTGHTGFKGSWLALLLRHLGASVTGIALPPATDPNLFERAGVAEGIDSRIIDIRDAAAIAAAVADCRPEVIFHLAGQPLVRLSYTTPVETWAVNVMGTAHILEAARAAGGVRAIVAVTSDKCYENREWVWPYRESDPLGGHDPYSSSKGAAELAVAAWRASFFPPERLVDHRCGIASVRAGNVIGGGDWSADRLVPDVLRAFAAGMAPAIRSPDAIRPWQHVLEAVVAYVRIAERLHAGDADFASAWNFGPASEDIRSVGWITGRLAALWGQPTAWRDWQGEARHEARLLALDCAKARAALGWRPTLGLDEALEWIVDWHRVEASGVDMRSHTLDQITRFLAREATTRRIAA